jgi:hypothetical protein
MTDARTIRVMLQERLPDLLARLFPRHDITYPVFAPLNPTRHDNTAGSFVIWTRGAGAGAWQEYSPRAAAKGDVIDLIAYVHRHGQDKAGRRFALAWAEDFLGLKTMSREARADAARAAKRQAQATVQIETAAAAEKKKRANALWSRTLPIMGSVAEDYLAARRIPLVLVKNLTGDLRFMPALEHWKSQKWDGNTLIERGPKFPAMVACLRNLAGDITAVHCTFLRHDGSGKADIGEAKLMRGVAKGSAIWLTNGPDNVNPLEARAGGIVNPLIVAEGIENGLTEALAIPEARVAAAGSFDLMLALPVRADIFDPVVYALDNDADPRHSEAMADHLFALREAGKRAGTMAPQGAKDFNDLLKE